MFLNDWAESGIDGMKQDFAITDEDLKGAEILLASYTYESYEGEAFVLFRRDGKLYEVNASHCSCYGLSESSYSGDTETQWHPEETSVAALNMRIEKGNLGASEYNGGGFAEKLSEILRSVNTG